jgi:hypothetical protein
MPVDAHKTAVWDPGGNVGTRAPANDTLIISKTRPSTFHLLLDEVLVFASD